MVNKLFILFIIVILTELPFFKFSDFSVKYLHSLLLFLLIIIPLIAILFAQGKQLLLTYMQCQIVWLIYCTIYITVFYLLLKANNYIQLVVDNSFLQAFALGIPLSTFLLCVFSYRISKYNNRKIKYA